MRKLFWETDVFSSLIWLVDNCKHSWRCTVNISALCYKKARLNFFKRGRGRKMINVYLGHANSHLCSRRSVEKGVGLSGDS